MTVDICKALPVFTPDWALPAGVCAIQTECGVGQSPYGGFNLGDHVGDDPQRVDQHRQQLAGQIGTRPVWLKQVHGTTVCCIDDSGSAEAPEADAVVIRQPGAACTIMTADCLPVLVADCRARVVGAAHAGWRGLAAGVIQELIAAMTATPGVSPGDLSVWLGPAIGPEAFEVGQDVVDVFTAQSGAHRSCFKAQSGSADKYLADLPALADAILHDLGVTEVQRSHLCTVSRPERFYSFRRDGVTGRMASLIWIS